MQMRLPVERNLNVKNPLPVDENPVHVRQRGESDSPFVFFPPQKKEQDRSHQHGGMIPHPKLAVKIGIGRMEGDPCQFIKKTVRQKGHRGRQSKGKAARSDSAKRLLDDDTGQDVRWLLHGGYGITV